MNDEDKQKIQGMPKTGLQNAILGQKDFSTPSTSTADTIPSNAIHTTPVTTVVDPTTPIQTAPVPEKTNSETLVPPIGQNQRIHTTETPQKAIRTYESDVADVLAHKKISTTTIAMAEQRRNSGLDRLGGIPQEMHGGPIPENQENLGDQKVEGPHINPKIIKNSLIVLASLILIGGGLTAAYYFYSISPLAMQSKPVVLVVAPISMVQSDFQTAISIDGMAPFDVIKAVRAEIAKSQPNNTIKEIILTQNKNGQRFRLGSSDITTIMDIHAPNILIRALSSNWMLGIYADSQGKKDVFVITDITYFQNAFAGMLQWENLMPDDLKQYLYQTVPAEINTIGLKISSSTTESATSTYTYKNNSSYQVLRGSFTDRIIQNKDVREFVTNTGPLFLYSFLDNTKLIFTGSESTLSEVLKRLEQKAYVR